MRRTLFSAAASTIRLASSTEVASGFSHSTGFLFSKKYVAISACVLGGVETITASTWSPSSSRR